MKKKVNATKRGHVTMFLTEGSWDGVKVSIYRWPVDKNGLISTFLEVIFRLMPADGFIPSPTFLVKTNHFHSVIHPLKKTVTIIVIIRIHLRTQRTVYEFQSTDE